MKLLLALLVFLPTIALADGMFGADVNVAGGSKPSYGFDLEKTYGYICAICGQEYTDIALSGNQGYGQLYLSKGTQYEHVNLGLAVAATATQIEGSRYATQLTFGPELGFMQNITRDVYIKENNNYMGAFGRWYLGASVSIGVNF